MKRVLPSIVMVEDITSPTTKKIFSEVDLEKAAQLILSMEGIIMPLVLLENGIDSYTLIEGEFEYYAALKAEEIDPIKGETINAYVIKSKKDLPFYQKQIDMFRKKSVVVPVKTPPKDNEDNSPVSSQTVDIQPIMNMLESLSVQVKVIANQQGKLNIKVDTNFSVLQGAIAKITIENPEPPVVKPDITATVSNLKEIFLNEINNLTEKQLKTKLEQAKANKTVITNIPLARQNGSFKSLEDIVKRTKRLGEITLAKIIDNWS